MDIKLKDASSAVGIYCVGWYAYGSTIDVFTLYSRM